MKASSNDYVLGDSPDERKRIRLQARRLRTLTRRFLCDAGVASGMRVLELGAGLGDVTRALARRVGDDGFVVALERSPAMLRQARRKINECKNHNVQLVECDVNAMDLSPSVHFDALVGRLILTHVADPAAVLQRALRYLRPGGIVAFQEVDFTVSNFLLDMHRDKLPLTHQVCRWIELAREGSTMNPRIGLDLYHIFRRAGLAAETVQLHTELYGGLNTARIANSVRFLREVLPKLEEQGIDVRQIDIDTLDARMTDEIAAADTVQALASIASAWAIVP